MPRNSYSAEVRQHAVALVIDSHLPVAQVARKLGCSINALHNWVKKHRQKNNSPLNSATLVPVNVIDNQQHSAEIVLPSGITIRLTDASPRSIAELVHALAPSC
jgi:transposase-like protein